MSLPNAPAVLPPSITNYWVLPGYDTTNGDAFRCWCYNNDGSPATGALDSSTLHQVADFLSLSIVAQPPSPTVGVKPGDFGFALVGAVAHTLSGPDLLGDFYEPRSSPSGSSSPPTTLVVLPVLPGTQRRGVILVFTGKDAATCTTLNLLASRDPEIKNSTGGSDGS